MGVALHAFAAVLIFLAPGHIDWADAGIVAARAILGGLIVTRTVAFALAMLVSIPAFSQTPGGTCNARLQASMDNMENVFRMLLWFKDDTDVRSWCKWMQEHYPSLQATPDLIKSCLRDDDIQSGRRKEELLENSQHVVGEARLEMKQRCRQD